MLGGKCLEQTPLDPAAAGRGGGLPPHVAAARGSSLGFKQKKTNKEEDGDRQTAHTHTHTHTHTVLEPTTAQNPMDDRPCIVVQAVARSVQATCHEPVTAHPHTHTHTHKNHVTGNFATIPSSA